MDNRLLSMAKIWTFNVFSNALNIFLTSNDLLNGHKNQKSLFRKKAEKEGKGVLINSVCPGFVKTDMSSHSPKSPKFPAQGCKTSLWLALLPEGLDGPQGGFLLDA